MFILPIVFIVGSFSWYMLSKDHQEVPPTTRMWITIGAMILSAILAYFLFPRNEKNIYDEDEKK